MDTSLFRAGRLDFNQLAQATQKPALFEQWEPNFWIDPHISQQMLAAHLDPDVEAASRSPRLIDQTVAWILNQTKLPAGAAILDLGCGPGLYTKRWADQGYRVTGVDQSSNSIAYARQVDPISTYHCQNYLSLEFEAQFDLAVLIFGDFCVLPDAERDQLLAVVHRALKPDGWFIFDVSTWQQCENRPKAKTWSLHPQGGFWKAEPHLVLSELIAYPEHQAWVDQYTIIEADGTVTVYYTWLQSYTPARITTVLQAHGFSLKSICSDLMGTAYQPATEWLGLTTHRRDRAIASD